MIKSMSKPRCTWVPQDKPDYIHYHDTEWAVPVHNDKQLFEMLILEGAQAGLSWYTVLKRRDAYREVFKNFDPTACAKMTDAELDEAQMNKGIIRNKLKIYSVRNNARVFLNIQKEFGSFDAYLWRYVDGTPKIGGKNAQTTSKESDGISKDLKKRGMSFVGSTIIYAYMQAIGMVNDHMNGCYLTPK